ncbi:MAG: prepilin-type N-terminal cleavage/methylation domain-containing protein [Symbiobacteriia bacterium]
MMRFIWNRFARVTRNERGFTLIELLVVLAILAVIAAVAIPRVQMTTSQAKTTRDNANRAIVQSAIERYHLDEDKWPTANGAPGVIVPGKLIPDYLAKDVPLGQDATTGADQNIADYSVDASGLITP